MIHFKNICIIGALVPAAALVAFAASIATGSKTTIEGKNNLGIRASDQFIPEEDANKPVFFEYMLFAGTGGEAEILQIMQNELLFRSGSDLVLIDRKDGAIKWRFHDPQRYFQ